MTEEEINRFATVLRECERIRAIMAEDESARTNGGDEGIPVGITTGMPSLEAPADGWAPDPVPFAA
ncbi:MAG: hypothetical protein AVDCRST_MAG22-854 [uncultured Rubrobacteraceae bacterium]|uniref:Uncharacterized protein n=1 Tax=uncultured Rubrobacteraceae bacterium TaxID=349277 RepID=A0A6J4NUB0_9ACTN|nr:MAG: hypothetical protein AVDCRST_MAG22-854 [uncultured Rubrobacteraceae bacterium]